MEHKILITGTMGAGKTTAIGQISEIPPISTDVENSRRDDFDKPTTTAAFDYGELDLGEGEVLRIYGTPGQERFSFMWPVLARGAIGIIYLIDCSRPEPLADLENFIDAFGSTADNVASVVALNRIPEDQPLAVETFQALLESRGLPWPAMSADVRRREDVLDVLEILLSLGEAQTASMEA